MCHVLFQPLDHPGMKRVSGSCCATILRFPYHSFADLKIFASFRIILISNGIVVGSSGAQFA
jgi:hypothetical protein